MANIHDMHFTYPLTFKISQKIALILAKFQLGHFVDEVIINNDLQTETMFFSSYDHRDKSITFKHNGRDFCIVEMYNYKRKNQQTLNVRFIGATVFVNEVIAEKFGQFLSHPKGSNRDFKVVGSAKCNFDPDKHEFRNVDSFIRNIKFFEYAFDEILPLLAGIRTFNKLERFDKLTFSINQFGKLKSSINTFETLQKPNMDSVNKVIDCLIFFKTNKIDSVKCGSISASKDPISTTLKSVKIKIGGIQIINEISFEPFKHMFHPGIYMLAYFLEKRGQLRNFDLAIQKELFRTI